MKELQLVSDINCEKSVLSSIIYGTCDVNDIREFLTEDCFYYETTRSIYQAIIRVADAGDKVDMLSVAGELKKMGSNITAMQLAEIGTAFTSYEIQRDSIRLKDLDMRRKLTLIGTELSNACSTEMTDIGEIMQATKDKIESVFSNVDTGVVLLRDIIKNLFDIIAQNSNSNGCLTGTTTGFKKIDEKGGLQPGNLVIVAGETSQGKALRMDELILTENGEWVKNCDLKIGDRLASIDGELSVVTGVYPQGVKPMYRITFSDGRTAVASEDHLWEVGSSAFKSGNRILTTKQIKEMQNNSVAFRNRMYLPEFCGKYGVKKDFVIPPYILGVLIGDGCLSRGTAISNCEDFIYNKIKKLCSLNVVKRISPTSNDVISIKAHSRKEINTYRVELERLGLLNCLSHDKFIPKEYLDCCFEQRLELLNGLLDTDGEATFCNGISYSTISPQLAKDFTYLCYSLGFRCYINRHKSALNGKKFSDHYRLSVASNGYDEMLFTLPRKKDKIKQRVRVHNVIQKVEYIGDEECQCIKVSHPRELFVMRDFIMTHNTSLALSMAYNAIQTGAKVAMYSMEMTNEELGARLLSINSGVSSSEILYSSRLGEEKLKSLDYSAGVIKYDNMYFDDNSTSNIETILVSIRSMKIKHNISGAVVDYLQILNVNQKNSNKEQAMGDVARRLKNLAKELGIWIIALSQLNRNSDNPVPNLNRLRDSGQIAEAADLVIFVYRPEYYGKAFPEPFENIAVEDKAMIDIAKGRNVGTARFVCDFHKKTTFFSDITEERGDVDFNGYAPF